MGTLFSAETLKKSMTSLVANYENRPEGAFEPAETQDELAGVTLNLFMKVKSCLERVEAKKVEEKSAGETRRTRRTSPGVRYALRVRVRMHVRHDALKRSSRGPDSLNPDVLNPDVLNPEP